MCEVVKINHGKGHTYFDVMYGTTFISRHGTRREAEAMLTRLNK